MNPYPIEVAHWMQAEIVPRLKDGRLKLEDATRVFPPHYVRDLIMFYMLGVINRPTVSYITKRMEEIYWEGRNNVSGGH